MKTKFLKEGGQALILIAFGAIALFAIAGLAIDGSAKYSDRRHAQNAADTAAIAGALKMTADKTTGVKCPPISGSPTPACADIIDAAKNRAADNGYDDNKVTNIVEVNIPPATGIYADCGDVHFDCTDYVQVIITTHKPTWFMRVLGIKEMSNVVQGVASIIGENTNFTFGGNAVVALAPSSGCSSPDESSLMSQGSSKVTIIGGGMYSNSDNTTCAFQRNSCPAGFLNVYTDSSMTTKSTISMVGSTTSGCISTQAVFTSGAKQIPFPPPYQEIAEPSQCSEAVDLGSNYSVSGSAPNTIAHVKPGHYSKWPLQGSWKSMILDPGVYCIDTAFSSPANNITVAGTPTSTAGVFIYIRPSGSATPLALNGGSTLDLWGINDSNDASVSQYKGFLIYVAPDFSTGTPDSCLINGNSDYALKGTIYAPYCNVTIDGTSNTGKFLSQVIGYKVKFAGTADVLLNYDDGDNHVWNIPSQVGLTK